ncbi:uncharacterized protein LOC141905651 [Tubulanus polymorphus]|uniref:uncharacterized protein LOC141905651 n=1 Tax=Tubulanus polymorphus TaxID=672921 RepID=UPI003DA60B17
MKRQPLQKLPVLRNGNDVITPPVNTPTSDREFVYPPSSQSRRLRSDSRSSMGTSASFRSGRSSVCDDSSDQESRRQPSRSDSRASLATRKISMIETSRSQATVKAKTSVPNFASFSKKVMHMMSFKRQLGFGKRDPYENDPFGPIRELPRMPRFSATLSAEAQYAMMKGYEDLLVGYLKQYYPENALFLPRTKTPPTKNMKVVTVDILDNESVREIEKESEITETGRTGQIVPHMVQRANTEPARKQLVVTYRFQNAMDILDAVKKEKGYHVTSPRPLKRDITPVMYYKSWANHWGDEFKFMRNK